jgi:outer membrane protein, heavy metal efflux system
MFTTPHNTAAAFLFTVASAALAAPAVPEPTELPSVLRLEEARRLFRERGLDILIAEAAVNSAEGDVKLAGAIPNPALSASYGRSFTYGNCVDAQGSPTSCGVLPTPLYGIGLSDQGALFDSVTGKRGLRLRVAGSALAASRASRDDALRTVGAQVKQTFLQALIAKEALRFAREVAAASARTADLTRVRYESGAISEADLARIEVAKLEADQAADTAGQTYRDARVSLAFLLGVRGPIPDYDVEEPDLLHSAAPRALQDPTSDALLARARLRRSDLAAALRQRERAEAALALARRQRFPEITLSVNYTQEGSTNTAVTPPTLTAGVSLPLPLFYRQQGEIQKAQADVETQALQAAKIDAQVVSDVETGLSDYRTSAQLARRMEGGLLERARRARDLVAVQYEKGAASLLDYLDARRTFIATSVEYLQDLALFWGAVFKLEQAVGEEMR